MHPPAPVSATQKPAPPKSGLMFTPFFSDPGKHPFDAVVWEKRTARLENIKGEVIFEQQHVEMPQSWSQNATNIVASRYFYGDQKKGHRESSLRELIGRVVETIARWGKRDGYFRTDADAQTFERELAALTVNQYGSFNSPVWFNVGIDRYEKGSGAGRYFWDPQTQTAVPCADDYSHPQCSACFIISVQDKLDSILNHVKVEGTIFKFGSGTGINLSTLRSSKEKLSGGGRASGPVSFMRGYDAFAGVIKSGGKTRRAAKMVMLDADHPDIMEFIDAKEKEERKAWALMDAGYDGSIGGEAYESVFFQNANHSVRVSDAFMQAAENGEDYFTRAVMGNEPVDKLNARQVLRRISEATHLCGDPGLQFDSTINDWHTCANTDRIYASNPCSEYMFLNDTACNLASLNLMKFLDDRGNFQVNAFNQAVRLFTTAMDIIVDNASYPMETMVRNSHDYRTLGLGFANLGAVLMRKGLPYDSDEGRAYAGAVTALMTGTAYEQSAVMAEAIGTFPGFDQNREPTVNVMRKHRDAMADIDPDKVELPLYAAAKDAWDNVVEQSARVGLRNAQTTVLAPTGTIAFMMDCDTTGVEPDIALVKYKKLVGGGYMKIVNQTVRKALQSLRYADEAIDQIVTYIDANDTIEGAPDLKGEHLPVFDCAFKPAKGERFISYMGHIRMMAAAQPFISGAISKTVNLPHDATTDDIMEAYLQAWKLGLKAIAIYRDGSKRIQPLNTNKEEKQAEKTEALAPVYAPQRRRLPDERRSLTHKFTVGGHTGYLTVGLYEDGTPGEIFVTIAKDGSVVSGLMDSFATAVSLALQYGVPLPVMVNQFAHRRFEPSGFTNHPNIRIAKSFVDYIFRWLALKFLPAAEAAAVGVNKGEAQAIEQATAEYLERKDEPENATVSADPADGARTFTFDNQADAPACPTCGEIMVRNASCYKCLNCGATSGCS